MTNREWLNSLSDKEYASWLTEVDFNLPCDYCPRHNAIDYLDACMSVDCAVPQEAWEAWLAAEYKEQDDGNNLQETRERLEREQFYYGKGYCEGRKDLVQEITDRLMEEFTHYEDDFYNGYDVGIDRAIEIIKDMVGVANEKA